MTTPTRPTKVERQQAERGRQARAIVDAFDHDQAHLLAVAARAFADTLDITDELHPSPEMRAQVHQLRQLADLLRHTNITRDIIEGGH